MNESPEVRLAVLEERSRSDAIILALQAKEYERRLTDLNHAHAKQVADQSTYISEDRFDGFEKAVAVWREQVQTKLAGRDGFDMGGQTLRTLVLLAVGAAISYLLTRIGA